MYHIPMIIDDDKIFRTMQAIDKAREKPSHKPGQTIEIYSQQTSEMGYLAQGDFGNALKELKKRCVLTIDSFPDDSNKKYESHFRVTPTEKKFKSLYKELAKKNPQAIDPGSIKKPLSYKGLVFCVKDGSFKYGKIEGNLRPYSEPWSILFTLMVAPRGSMVTRDTMKAQIIYSWNIKGSKKRQKHQDHIDVQDIIKRLKRKLKMGGVKSGVNPNLIHGDGHLTGYYLK